MKRFGGTPEEWAALKRLAKVDLLPVVSNPHAEISPHSKMKGLGKTPSLYNNARQVKGFPEWTDWETTVRNLEAWSAEPDYGICIQTRRIRGFDCDVPDQELSDRIAIRFAELIEDEDGPPLAMRFRRDSGKKLLAFICEEPLNKRSFVVKEWLDEASGKTKRWIVELLADGQQFVAAGTHTDGARYEWAGGVPERLPSYSLARLDRAWRVLVREFALEGVDRQAQRRDPTLLEDLDVADPVAEHLIESDWPTYTCEKGMLYVECPNADSHGSDNGETQTAWLLAGTGQYRNGHFRCMHAGCSHITDAAFFAEVGYRPLKAEAFDDLSEDDDAEALYGKVAAVVSPKPKAQALAVFSGAGLPLPGFNRDPQGRIETTLENVYRALGAPQASECEIAFDTFRAELMIADAPEQWRSMTDADQVRLRARLEALGFKEKIGKELMRDVLEWLGDERQFDSAVKWLTEVVPAWDGVPRIHRFWPDYLETKDTPYTRALGNYTWTAQAGRILEPGCQVDMVPVMVGGEGLRKTSIIAALAPAREFFAEFSFEDDDTENARKMRGCIVGELAELKGVSSRDGETVKSWITRREEKWTPKFKEHAKALARRLVFYGTTNDFDFLKPHMGERRWLPVIVGARIELRPIERDRLQLWAEARDTWQHDGGVAWEVVERLAFGERDSFRETHKWQEQVAAWLDDPIDVDAPHLTPRACGTLRGEQVLAECIGVLAARISKRDQMDIGEALLACGMVRKQRWVGGRNVKVWVDRKTADEWLAR